MKSVALLAALVAAAFAQHWDIEQVDSAGWGQGVQMTRHPDGRLFLCYANVTIGHVRVAWKEGLWHTEDVPQPAQTNLNLPWLAIGPHGELGVTCSNHQQSWLSVKQDTGWRSIGVPFEPEGYPPVIPMVFDSAAQPVLNIVIDEGWVRWVGLARLVDSVWVPTDTISGGPRAPEYRLVGFGLRPDGTPWGVEWVRVIDVGYWLEGVEGFEWRAGAWYLHWWYGGERMYVGAVDGAVDRDGTVHAAYVGSDSAGSSFRYDQDIIPTALPDRIALSFDSLNRPFIAYSVDSVLKFCYRENSNWRFFDVGVSGVRWLDVIAEPDGRPAIAYCTSEGVFVARGKDVTGQSEEGQEPTASSLRPTASVVRNVLFLPANDEGRMARSELLDASGRRVMVLKAGANDVRALAPGVYFVRTHDVDVRKVVIAG